MKNYSQNKFFFQQVRSRCISTQKLRRTAYKNINRQYITNSSCHINVQRHELYRYIHARKGDYGHAS